MTDFSEINKRMGTFILDSSMPPFLILHGHSDEIVRNDSLLSPARFLLRLFAQLDKIIFKVAYSN